MNEINADTNIEELDITDYPYIGLGKKPTQPNKYATDDDLEKIIGG